MRAANGEQDPRSSSAGILKEISGAFNRGALNNYRKDMVLLEPTLGAILFDDDDDTNGLSEPWNDH